METAIYDGICRCCASEGSFKDVNDTYHWMGEEEVYADMLKECFNVSLSLSAEQNGGICEVCITQLRNASNFKKQVLHTEEQFQKHLHMKIFKPVKIEVDTLENKHENDDNSSIEDGFSGTEIDMPIKSEDTPEEAKPKKRAAKTAKSKTKKSKSEKAETSNQRKKETAALKRREAVVKLRRIQVPAGIRKKGIIEIKSSPAMRFELLRKIEVDKHRENFMTIMKCSNATPIRRYVGIGYVCCFCTAQYSVPSDLKEHTLNVHKDADDKIKEYVKTFSMSTLIIKLDITSLRCTLCGNPMDSIEELMQHLIEEHQQHLHEDIKDHIVPFRFDSEVIKCVFCSKEQNNFKVLLEHMNIHFRNHVCEVCGGGFVNRRILQAHMYRHRTGVFGCSHCPKVFDTRIKQKYHERTLHELSNKRSKCGYCGEKFSDYTKKHEHEVQKHGARAVVLRCHACDKTFDNQRSLTVHTKRYHMMQRRVVK